ncbi:hypothetical protein [Fodinicurvata sediminis]|uniref:hypothetical protein n=1 Tax=Fodinicurvata sediminis TaxID=1121832 RepID=UPI0003B5AE3A|nr:hypothetical protein [Fodinicurvata sediminis]
MGIESQNHIRQNEQGPRNYGAYSEGAHRPGEMKVPEHDDLSFWDVLDVVNPLQHIPGVNMAYRAITGDQMEAPARILGGMLYGGPTGFVSAIANSLLEEGTGRDMGETVIAQVFGEDAAPIDKGGQQYASNESGSRSAAAEQAPAQMTQSNESARQSSVDTRTAPASGSDTGELTGMDALRAFASDQQASPSSAQQSHAVPGKKSVPEDKKDGDYYALNPSATLPTTAATTANPADGGQPGEIQQAQAPLSAPANRSTGGPPPADSFMPLDRGSLRGRTAAASERPPLPESVSGAAADQKMSAGSMQGGETMGLPGSAMNVMPGEPRDESRPLPAAPGLSAPNDSAFRDMNATGQTGGNVAEQMKAALLKYQALEDE